MTTGGPCPDTPEGFCMVHVAAILMSVHACSSYPCHSVARTLSAPTFTLSLEPEKENKVQCQWNCWWKTMRMRARPPWWIWKASLMRMTDHTDQRPPSYDWKTTLVRLKDHPDERPPWWETTLVKLKDRPDETDRPHWSTVTLMRTSLRDRDHPDQRSLWWEITLMRLRDHPNERPLW